MDHDFDKLTRYAKALSGLTPELELILQQTSSQIKSKLGILTEDCYQKLSMIEDAANLPEGRFDTWKATQFGWMEILFNGQYEQAYVEYMYEVGFVHVKEHLPFECTTIGMTLINNRLSAILVETYGDDKAYLTKVLEAVSAITGLSLLIMQQSYQEARLAGELEKFLMISGMSRQLFNNLALAYKDVCVVPAAQSLKQQSM